MGHSPWGYEELDTIEVTKYIRTLGTHQPLLQLRPSLRCVMLNFFSRV